MTRKGLAVFTAVAFSLVTVTGCASTDTPEDPEAQEAEGSEDDETDEAADEAEGADAEDEGQTPESDASGTDADGASAEAPVETPMERLDPPFRVWNLLRFQKYRLLENLDTRIRVVQGIAEAYQQAIYGSTDQRRARELRETRQEWVDLEEDLQTEFANLRQDYERLSARMPAAPEGEGEEFNGWIISLDQLFRQLRNLDREIAQALRNSQIYWEESFDTSNTPAQRDEYSEISHEWEEVQEEAQERFNTLLGNFHELSGQVPGADEPELPGRPSGREKQEEASSDDEPVEGESTEETDVESTGGLPPSPNRR